MSPLYLKKFLPVDKKLKSAFYTLLIKSKESIFYGIKNEKFDKKVWG